MQENKQAKSHKYPPIKDFGSDSKKKLRVFRFNGRHDTGPSAIAFQNSYSRPHLVGKGFVVVVVVVVTKNLIAGAILEKVMDW